jgi:hypothetical protein
MAKLHLSVEIDRFKREVVVKARRALGLGRSDMRAVRMSRMVER